MSQIILSILVGFAIGRFVSKRVLVIALSLSIGVVMGLLSGLEIAPLLYPLMVVRIPWVGVPEIRRVGLAFGYPDIVLFAESIHFQAFSLIMISVLLAASIIGVFLGVYIGIRFRGTDVDSPWESIEETE